MKFSFEYIISTPRPERTKLGVQRNCQEQKKRKKNYKIDYQAENRAILFFPALCHCNESCVPCFELLGCLHSAPLLCFCTSLFS